MSKTTNLYRCYKRKETLAFDLLFGHSNWRYWTFRKLVSLTKRKLPSLGRKRNEFVSLLEAATACRLEIFAAFENAPEIRKAQHRYVVVCYQDILSGLASLHVHPDEVLGGGIGFDDETIDATDYKDLESVEESIDSLQGYLFFDILEQYIDAMLFLWRQAREDAISVLTATTGTLMVSRL